MVAQPFVKWVGGKRQLLPEIRKHYPKAFTEPNAIPKIDTYIEPFVGGGAVLFDILSTCPKNNLPKRIVINDLNETLILTYKMIQKKVNDVIAILLKLEKQFYYAKNIDEYHNTKDNLKNYYNTIRDKYNHEALSDPEKAAYFIFLNRTCFNGLYRLNKNGEFNVPLGKQNRPTLCDTANLKAVSKALKGVTITNTDYKTCIATYLTPNSFIYIDPPYRPLNDTSNFTAYTAGKFTDDNQKELADTINDINAYGAQFLLSNSDPHNSDPNDNFFDDLYKDYTIERIMASRAINSNGAGRAKITELLIYNN